MSRKPVPVVVMSIILILSVAGVAFTQLKWSGGPEMETTVNTGGINVVWEPEPISNCTPDVLTISGKDAIMTMDDAKPGDVLTCSFHYTNMGTFDVIIKGLETDCVDQNGDPCGGAIDVTLPTIVEHTLVPSPSTPSTAYFDISFEVMPEAQQNWEYVFTATLRAEQP